MNYRERIKKIKKRLDKVIREYVILRDKHCVTCGGTRNDEILQCGHLFSRTALSTRWNQKNLYCQCRTCNMLHEGNTYPLTEYARQVWKEEIEQLSRLWFQAWKPTLDDLQIIEDYYENEIERLKGAQFREPVDVPEEIKIYVGVE